MLKLERFQKCIQRMGFVQGDALTVVALVSSAEDTLLQSIVSNPNHVLSGLMPATDIRNYNLRPAPQLRVT